jgi:hypothetical protein
MFLRDVQRGRLDGDADGDVDDDDTMIENWSE